jgi:hypothetical protein
MARQSWPSQHYLSVKTCHRRARLLAKIWIELNPGFSHHLICRFLLSVVYGVVPLTLTTKGTVVV